MGLLVSLSDYKTWRNITGTALDTALTQILTFVSSDVREFCGRNETNGFESATRTETYSGQDETTIQLREWPVTSITSITRLWSGGSTETLTSSTYRVDSETGILSRIDAIRGRFASWGDLRTAPAGTWVPSPNFAEGFFNYSIVYVGGYSSIPGSLQMAVCQLADNAYASKARDFAVTSKSLGQYAVTYADPMKAIDIKANLLRPFNTGST